MKYENIDWDNVESAVATEAGLQLTYRTPQVGVGQTQMIPLEIEGTVGQAREFNTRFGPTLAVFSRNSPPGSYGQYPQGATLQQQAACAALRTAINNACTAHNDLVKTYQAMLQAGVQQYAKDLMTGLIQKARANHTQLLQLAGSIGCFWAMQPGDCVLLEMLNYGSGGGISGT